MKKILGLLCLGITFEVVFRIGLILLHGIQLTNVQCYQGSTMKMVLSYKICTLNDANTCVELPNACRRLVPALS
jgi:hypothetical protein